MKSEFIRKLDIAQEEFIKFHFNKQLEGEEEKSDELSDDELDEILSNIPDELNLNKLENEIESDEEILVNKKEYENLKDYFITFSDKEIKMTDFSAINDKKWYMMDVIE